MNSRRKKISLQLHAQPSSYHLVDLLQRAVQPGQYSLCVPCHKFFSMFLLLGTHLQLVAFMIYATQHDNPSKNITSYSYLSSYQLLHLIFCPQILFYSYTTLLVRKLVAYAAAIALYGYLICYTIKYSNFARLVLEHDNERLRNAASHQIFRYLLVAHNHLAFLPLLHILTDGCVNLDTDVDYFAAHLAVSIALAATAVLVSYII